MDIVLQFALPLPAPFDSSRLAPTHSEWIFICSSWNIEQRLCQDDDRLALYATQLGAMRNSFDLSLLVAIDYNVLFKHDDATAKSDHIMIHRENCLLN